MVSKSEDSDYNLGYCYEYDISTSKYNKIYSLNFKIEIFNQSCHYFLSYKF